MSDLKPFPSEHETFASQARAPEPPEQEHAKGFTRFHYQVPAESKAAVKVLHESKLPETKPFPGHPHITDTPDDPPDPIYDDGREVPSETTGAD